MVDITPLKSDGATATFGGNKNNYSFKIFINKDIVEDGSVTLDIFENNFLVNSYEISWSGEYPFLYTINMSNAIKQNDPFIGNMITRFIIRSNGKSYQSTSLPGPEIDYNIGRSSANPEDSNMNYTYMVRTNKEKDIHFSLTVKRKNKDDFIVDDSDTKYFIESNFKEYRQMTWIIPINTVGSSRDSKIGVRI
jgi:hypothetical protein